MSYNDAANTCSAIGSRLCTASELVSGIAQGTGAGHDFRFVWSQSDCSKCGSQSRMTVRVADGADGLADMQCRAINQPANVRCCADHRIQESAVLGTSCTTCDQLRFQSNASDWDSGAIGGKQVCAASKIATTSGDESTCVPFVTTFRQAEQFCSDIGARLCSTPQAKVELQASECDPEDDFWLWTRTPCDGGFKAVPGRGNGNTATQCINVNQRREVRCCADDDAVVSDYTCDYHRTTPTNADNTEIPASNTIRGWTNNSFAGAALNRYCISPYVATDTTGLAYESDSRVLFTQTPEYAERVCAANGARLCSAWELDAKMAGMPSNSQYYVLQSTCQTADGSPGHLAKIPGQSRWR